MVRQPKQGVGIHVWIPLGGLSVGGHRRGGGRERRAVWIPPGGYILRLEGWGGNCAGGLVVCSFLSSILGGFKA